MLNVQFNTKFLEYLIIKLLAIIGDKNMQKFELAYDGFPKEVFDFALSNVCQELCLHLFVK